MTYLPRDGREFFHWSFTGLPSGATVEVRIGGQWYPLEMDGGEGRLLLAGPDADLGDGVRVVADEALVMRVTDSPEIVVRSGGSVQIGV